ncbi:MAG: hydroxymethylpyrimidine/phosphomethylpyrimidine kinase, partial [Myxococcales bacterium]|nr:hydroxymethylpyrimidine/phosphomethylpyrimidine kinase [Myxococcales bacterium]
MPYRDTPPVLDAPAVLLCAGLDPSAGAGLLADARLATILGCRPVGVATALTEQNSLAVVAANPVDPDTVGGQLSTLLSDVEVVAIKLGMLGSAGTAHAVADAFALTVAPVVWDPVLRPTRGDVPLFDGDPRQAVELLAPHLTLITPNADEAGLLTGTRVVDEASAVAAAEALRARGVPAVLVKGGHLTGEEAVDLLVTGDGVVALRGPRVQLPEPVHGTGCALSTAIACLLARGRALPDACAEAKEIVAERLR